jgi:carbon-monoxide dehydrogenase small subunit
VTERQRVTLTVNGMEHVVEVEPRRTLVDVLRHDLGYTGTHVGCEQGVCGSCTVLLDGEPVRSCLVFGVQADGADVRRWRAHTRSTRRCCRIFSSATPSAG